MTSEESWFVITDLWDGISCYQIKYVQAVPEFTAERTQQPRKPGPKEIPV